MYLIGYDIGSSSIKAALVDADSGKTIGISHYPDTEMEIISLKPDWAEQQPEVWWNNLKEATQRLLKKTGIAPSDIQSIGISYQMHGLVLVDQNHEVLRPSIIWCDSRAIPVGAKTYNELGEKYCLNHLLNSPGNFTASKLKWVLDHEPEIYNKAWKMLLPGDYIALKMTGEALTSISGLSEGILWDFKEETPAYDLIHHLGIDSEILPEAVPSISPQGDLDEEAAKFLGLAKGTPVTYRAGDQPNNAMSLNVLNPGEVAATGGTSGVVYGVVSNPVIDRESRINSFAHVNHTQKDPRIGVLLCINGAGIQYSWMKQMLSEEGTSYNDLEKIVSSVEVNSDGLKIIPFGNGSERILGNRNPGAHISNLQFNRHGKAHLYRAALEGIAYSFVYGIEVMKEMGMKLDVIKVGNDNLFQSEVFSTTISTLLDCEIEMIDATGAIGAAKASGVAIGKYSSLVQAFEGLTPLKRFGTANEKDKYKHGYNSWKSELKKIVKN